MITHLKFISIPGTDQDRALDFWTNKVGFRLMTDQPFNERQRWIELSIGDSLTRLDLFTPEGQEERAGGIFNGSFACDDVEATFRQLTEKGVEFVQPPQKTQWGGFAIFKDPDGNQFVLGTRS